MSDEQQKAKRKKIQEDKLAKKVSELDAKIVELNQTNNSLVNQANQIIESLNKEIRTMKKIIGDNATIIRTLRATLNVFGDAYDHAITPEVIPAEMVVDEDGKV